MAELRAPSRNRRRHARRQSRGCFISSRELLPLPACCPPCLSDDQRSPLEYTFFRPFPRLVFGCINADFCVQGRIFQRFSSSTFFSFAPFQISLIFQDLCTVFH